MAKSIGRPLKYDRILNSLNDHELYSPASIAHFAQENGLLDANSPQQVKLARQRVRIAMGRLCNYHSFPDEGDGCIVLPKLRPMPAWYGWRWKLVLEGNYEGARKRIES